MASRWIMWISKRRWHANHHRSLHRHTADEEVGDPLFTFDEYLTYDGSFKAFNVSGLAIIPRQPRPP